jgi:hypothetical protein
VSASAPHSGCSSRLKPRLDVPDLDLTEVPGPTAGPVRRCAALTGLGFAPTTRSRRARALTLLPEDGGVETLLLDAGSGWRCEV